MHNKRKTAGMQPAARAGNTTQNSMHLDYITRIQNAQISVFVNPDETDRGRPC